jgi:hypothetical protein
LNEEGYVMKALSETAKLIMDVLRDSNVGKNGSLPAPTLLNKRNDWNRDDQDNFGQALKELEVAGYIREGKIGIILTEKGHNYLYPPYK